MKKFLLTTPSKVARFYFRTLAVLSLLIGVTTTSHAQCNVYEQYYSGSSPIAAGFSSTGFAPQITVAAGGTSASARTGTYAFTVTTSGVPGNYIETPTISNPDVFSFWMKRAAGTFTDANFDLQVNDGFNGWVSLKNAANLTNYDITVFSFPGGAPELTAPGVSLTTTWQKSTVKFGNSPVAPFVNTNLKFRIVDNRGALFNRAMWIDDISWSSKTASLNTMIVPDLCTPLAPTPVTSTTCTSPLAVGQQYTLYDVGGEYDFYSFSQDNTLTFTPTAGNKIKVTFVTYNSEATNDYINVLDGATQMLTPNNFSGSSNPTPLIYTGTVGNNMTIRFISNVTTTTIFEGFKIIVECESGSACSVPGALNAPTNIRSNRVTATWGAAAGPPGGYDIFYSTNAAAVPGVPNFTNVASGAFITGLTPSTTYYYWVRSNCGGSQSAWVGPSAAFTTICAGISPPYTESFNGQPTTDIPSCTYSDNLSWQVNTVNGYLTNNLVGANWFTRGVNLAGFPTEYRLSYDYGSALGDLDLNVYYGQTSNAPTTPVTWTLLASNVNVTGLSNAIVNFTTGFVGTYYIRFELARASAPGTTTLILDNINLIQETCGPGRTLVASAVTASAATVSWVAPAAPYSPPANGYQYFLSTSSATPAYSVTPSGTTPAGVTTVSLTGLSDNTVYYIWVRSNCSGYYSSWSVPTSFTTLVGLTPLLLNGSVTSRTGCDYSFFDSGGGASNYSPDFGDYTVTLYPGTVGEKVKVVFSSFATENFYDGLQIFNGNSIGAPLISSGLPVGNNATTCPAGSFYGTVSPGTIISSAADGSLTFRFRTDVSVLLAGWSAFVSCVIAPSITSFTPTDNACGTATTVVITGSNFFSSPSPYAVTGVSFNGVPAVSYTVNSLTQITATIPAGAISGPIRVSNATATSSSLTSFTVLAPPPVTTGVTICAGGSGSLTTTTVCNGFVNSGTTLAGALTAGVDLVAPRPNNSSNSAACGFVAGSNRNYQAIQFQVSVSGTYIFQASSPFDAMGYITSGPFVAGNCGSGTFVIGDDDSNGGLQPRMTVALVAGVTYTIYTTSYGGAGTVSGAYSYAVSPPSGGQIMLTGSPDMNWYTVASGGTPIGTGASFNPVGVPLSGLPNTNTPSTTTFYAGCSSNSTCRTATTFVINARPTVTFTVQPGATACTLTNVTYTTQPGQTNYIWTVPGVLGTDYTITSGGIGTASNTVTLQWLTTGVKTVTINYSNATNCAAAVATSSTATTVSASGFLTTVTPSGASICANVPQMLTATSVSANFFTWATTAGALFTDAACTVPYVALTNAATVYFKGIANATVTTTGTVGGSGCAAVTTVAITINKAIWTGVWSNGTGPTNAISAEFQGNFTSSINASATSGNLSACSVVVTSGAVLFNQGTLTVQNAVNVVGGSLTFDDASYDVSLYQPNAVTNAALVYSGGNTGNITFKRTSTPMYKLDYTYWSAPVYPQNLVAVSPMSPLFYYYDALAATPNWQVVTSGATIMDVGQGYLIRAPSNFPVYVTPLVPTPLNYTASFVGVPNNGSQSIPIGVSLGINQFNLLGNPYPSSLFADDFITANPNIGALYFWTHNTNIAPIGNGTYQYTDDDYAIYTLLGGTGTQPSGVNGAGNNTQPTGYIASGQGFFSKGVATITGSAPYYANYTNAMRKSGNNAQFFRTANSTVAQSTNSFEKHRYWLDITNTQGAFREVLVGYVESATMGIDRLFDAEMSETSNVIALYTMVDTKKISIQGRPLPFENSDTVPLAYKSTIASTYTITMPQYDGLFTSQHVYLEDRVLNIIHDLTEGSYTFATEIGTFEERFLLRYTTTTLGTNTPIFTENSVIVYKNNQGLFVNAGKAIMKTVTIFDIRGRVLATQKQVGATTTVFTTLPTTQQVLLVKIEDENGEIVTKKVVY